MIVRERGCRGTPLLQKIPVGIPRCHHYVGEEREPPDLIDCYLPQSLSAAAGIGILHQNLHIDVQRLPLVGLLLRRNESSHQTIETLGGPAILKTASYHPAKRMQLAILSADTLTCNHQFCYPQLQRKLAMTVISIRVISV
jgi:hypothetical protein